MHQPKPLPTLRAFLDSDLAYVFPAPGGGLATGTIEAGGDPDLYIASLAAKAKKRLGDNRDPFEYLTDHLKIVVNTRLFDDRTDKLIIKRISAWRKELAN